MPTNHDISDAWPVPRREAGVVTTQGDTCMNRSVKIVAMVALMASTGLAVATSRAMTSKEIMGKLNKGPKSLTQVLGRELKAPQPPWDEIQNQTREYVTLTADLCKCEPSKGEADSWAKLTKQYAEAAQALDGAAQKKDQAAAMAVHGRIMRSCAACHRAHRG
jgi:hypothetical protein